MICFRMARVLIPRFGLATRSKVMWASQRESENTNLNGLISPGMPFLMGNEPVNEKFFDWPLVLFNCRNLMLTLARVGEEHLRHETRGGTSLATFPRPQSNHRQIAQKCLLDSRYFIY